MTDVFRTMVVPAALTPLARALASGISPIGGTFMFEAGLQPVGGGEITHYCSTGFIGPEFAEYIADADALYAACVAAEAPVTLAQCQALVEQSDVSEEPPFVAFDRLGLVLLTEATLTP